MSTKNTDTFDMPRWFDRHLHIRDGEMLKLVLPCTLGQQAAGALIMPNLPDPISTIAKATAYRDRIDAITKNTDFKPCMTLYLTDDTTPEEVVRGYEHGAWCAVKLYMANQQGKGGTTGSAHGVKNLLGRYPVFAMMEKYSIPLLGHFEAVEDGVDEFEREIRSVERDLVPLLKHFPQLRIVVEHVTDGRTADYIVDVGRKAEIYATVTAHHLMINRNALFQGGMNPANYCKPVPKGEDHRLRVRKYVTSGNSHFGAGTDSAPHPEDAKSRPYGCAAGIFTAPSAVEMYATVFDEDNALQHLSPFLSENFLHLYGMKVSREKMVIKREPYKIPERIGNVRIFKGGETLPWKLIG